MLKAQLGSITKVKADVICNAANGCGPMGSGVAGAIKAAGGESIELQAILACKKARKFNAGAIYITGAGILPYQGVIHLVTMKYPGNYIGDCSYEAVRKCLKAMVALVKGMGEDFTVALPALGTGVGGLGKAEVAAIYKEILKPAKTRFIVVDPNPAFIDYIEED